ncbi:hypothetical protein ZIOFF_007573 [Zingiber officinale]|uniref:Uncharacterized protein n=1 Tax=Zingiber officinale TaxID=94328 RepID=A0A8J5M5W4_ZINOF|nr:hypothetical protein ZIOFF_007573 [Zingiber officinale]
MSLGFCVRVWKFAFLKCLVLVTGSGGGVLNSIALYFYCVVVFFLLRRRFVFVAPPRAGAVLSRFVETGEDSRDPGSPNHFIQFPSFLLDNLYRLWRTLGLIFVNELWLFWGFLTGYSSDSLSITRHASPSSPDGHYGRLDTEFLISDERKGMAGHDQNGSLLGLATSAVVSGRRDVSRQD